MHHLMLSAHYPARTRHLPAAYPVIEEIVEAFVEGFMSVAICNALNRRLNRAIYTKKLPKFVWYVHLISIIKSLEVCIFGGSASACLSLRPINVTQVLPKCRPDEN